MMTPAVALVMDVLLGMFDDVKGLAIGEVGLLVMDVMDLWFLPSPSMSATTTTTASAATAASEATASVTTSASISAAAAAASMVSVMSVTMMMDVVSMTSSMTTSSSTSTSVSSPAPSYVLNDWTPVVPETSLLLSLLLPLLLLSLPPGLLLFAIAAAASTDSTLTGVIFIVGLIQVGKIDGTSAQFRTSSFVGNKLVWTDQLVADILRFAKVVFLFI